MAFLKYRSPLRDEKGVALVLTVFVISLATILVVEFASTALFDQRISLHYSESVQGDYVLKSCRTLAQVLLEVPPTEDDLNATWFGQPWNAVGSLGTLPIEGFTGNPRLAIYDEASKLEISQLGRVNPSTLGNPSSQPGDPTGGEGTGGVSRDTVMVNAFAGLFESLGFVREGYKKEDYRTLGDVGFDAETQVAVLHDWIDSNSEAFSSQGFPGNGIENNGNKEWFFNRNPLTLEELLLVPGITSERLGRLDKFITVKSIPRINVNTASPEVLSAIGFGDTELSSLISTRLDSPIGQELVNLIGQNNPSVRSLIHFTSNSFSIVARAEMPASTRWMKAFITVTRRGDKSTATVQETVIY